MIFTVLNALLNSNQPNNLQFMLLLSKTSLLILLELVCNQKAPEGADGHRPWLKHAVILTLDRVKVISTCTIHVACATVWL